jgi:hypothetical protein
MSKTRGIGSVLLLMLVSACASTPAAERAERGGRAVITDAEIRNTHQANALGVVQALRPEWLRTPTTTSGQAGHQIQVYVDGNRMGGLDQLRQIMAGTVTSMQFLTGLEATQRWGLNHGSGAIVVSTR